MAAPGGAHRRHLRRGARAGPLRRTAAETAGICLLAGGLVSLAGCATIPGGGGTRDPLEPLNRITFRFNNTLDTAVMTPVARGYRDVTPAPVRRGAGNFFSNLHAPVVIVNDLLQGRFRQGGSDSARLAVNSTVGLFGLFDPASGMGLPRHRQDFGMTLGRWGVGPGPYLVLPFVGPSDVRDAVGVGADAQIDPLQQWSRQPAKYELRAVDLVDTRARLLGATAALQQSINPYVFMREGYLQHRYHLIHGGSAMPGLPEPPPPPPRGGQSGGD